MSPLLLKTETAPTREETWMTRGSAGQSAEMTMRTLRPRHGPDTHICVLGASEDQEASSFPHPALSEPLPLMALYPKSPAAPGQ